MEKQLETSEPVYQSQEPRHSQYSEHPCELGAYSQKFERRLIERVEKDIEQTSNNNNEVENIPSAFEVKQPVSYELENCFNREDCSKYVVDNLQGEEVRGGGPVVGNAHLEHVEDDAGHYDEFKAAVFHELMNGSSELVLMIDSRLELRLGFENESLNVNPVLVFLFEL